MDEITTRRLTRAEISHEIGGTGWRLVLGALRVRVPASSVAHAAELAQRIIAACGDSADDALELDVRPDSVLVALRSREARWITPRELDLALDLADLGLGLTQDGARTTQALEIGIDALDIDAVRPFWRAILGYVEIDGDLYDPDGQGPPVWFQQMDAPRPQRNRIHLDVSIPHDELPYRMRAAMEAGGTVTYDEQAPAFYVMTDAEGNEACLTTWRGRD